MRQTVVGAIIVDRIERPSYVVAARRTKPADLQRALRRLPGLDLATGELPPARDDLDTVDWLPSDRQAIASVARVMDARAS